MNLQNGIGSTELQKLQEPEFSTDENIIPLTVTHYMPVQTDEHGRKWYEHPRTEEKVFMEKASMHLDLHSGVGPMRQLVTGLTRVVEHPAPRGSAH